MAINETKAKLICKQAGFHCGQVDKATHCYEIISSSRYVKGWIWVEHDELITVSYTLKDDCDVELLSETKQFSDEAQWWDFCKELNNIKPKDVINPADFDPQFDNDPETEEQCFAKVRKGQELYRKRLEAFWGGACAITGIKQRELLRASHAKPWAECSSGKERLSPYNGLLLNVALDALFDKFIISFDDTGTIMISPHLRTEELAAVGINEHMKMRRIDIEHQPFLQWHRQRFHELLQKANQAPAPSNDQA